VGFGYRSNEDIPGDNAKFIHLAVAPKWTPSDGVEIRPFWKQGIFYDNTQSPSIFTAGQFLPPEIERRFFGQPWAKNHGNFRTFGVIGKADLSSALQLQGGLFQSRQLNEESFADLFLNTSPAGVADRVVVASEQQLRGSTSGEARLTRRFADGPRRHAVHLMLRGKDGSNEYAGSSVVPLGRALIGQYNPTPEPAFRFRERNLDEVRQTSVGIGYEGRWAGVGEFSVGLQKVGYDKTVIVPGSAPTTITSNPWVYNGTVAAHLSDRLALYAGYARGLEENGAAPEVAANRFQPLPALVTSQRDAGLRYRIRPNLTAIVGVFDVRKPYFNLNAANVFTRLGEVQHRGAELSLSGRLAQGLSIVAGAVIMEPKVSGEAVDLGRVGNRPVGQTGVLARVNLDYAPAWLGGMSVDTGIVVQGDRAASLTIDPATGEQLRAPEWVTASFGGRYRFRLRNVPAVLRVQMTNAFDTFAWQVGAAGSFRPNDPRRLFARLDFDL
jgi:iron complex outermembrane receptor protein